MATPLDDLFLIVPFPFKSGLTPRQKVEKLKEFSQSAPKIGKTEIQFYAKFELGMTGEEVEQVWDVLA